MKNQVALPGIAVPAPSGPESASERRGDSKPEAAPGAVRVISPDVPVVAPEAAPMEAAAPEAAPLEAAAPEATAPEAAASEAVTPEAALPGAASPKDAAPSLPDSASDAAPHSFNASEPAPHPQEGPAAWPSPDSLGPDSPGPDSPSPDSPAPDSQDASAPQVSPAAWEIPDAAAPARETENSAVHGAPGTAARPAETVAVARPAKKQRKPATSPAPLLSPQLSPQLTEDQPAESQTDDWPPMSEILQSFFIFEPTTAEPSPITVLGLDCARPRGLLDLTAAQRDLLQKADVICGGRHLLRELTDAAEEKNPADQSDAARASSHASSDTASPAPAPASAPDSAPGSAPVSTLAAYEDNAGPHTLKARLLPLSTPLQPVLTRLSQMRASGERVVMLADGDPLLFGIGATLVRLLGQDAVRLLPAVSSLQQACARLALPWHRVICLSLHGRDDLGPLNAAVSKNAPLCVLTDARMTPDFLTRHLLDRGVDWFRAHVFERMGAPDEICHNLDMAQAASTSFGPACTLVLVPADTPRRARLGLEAHELAVDRGLISKKPVRAAALALLRIEPHHVVWDVGAGSGAVALEAAVLAHEGRVIAVERSVGRAMSIQENRRRFGVAILDVRLGEAPECLTSLPDPHRVFIGGGLSGEDGEDILGHVCLRLPVGGRVVASCVLLDTLCLCRNFFERLGWPVEICQIQASEGRELGGDVHLAAMNPVFLLTAQKPAPDGVMQKREHE
ncbi:MAG: precorrin-6y C5,15-methyltransferase (decarboxylating) subunit CbiE [Desulfovibrio sp.]|uniref:precorrin-6y C5,15-methyltransferase (decarboxylating) subunit CbiE n=1 Tax=Desulfovibrio sp. TaxID=885 RepID=UPI002A3658EF|nr:precorrin-6y C5,15-methyltransferase (decarboxylating) subunit CbiE [Desulfovibrio sp.]MDY0260431.1 precorrin-6y C5,15-methyltransferase (decarboxylating) subunit CbiE [Desulfovibrio sp.]